MGLFFTNFSNTISKYDTASNLISIPINTTYGKNIIYENNSIFQLIKHNINDLNINFYYDNDESIMKNGSGNIPVNFIIEFFYDGDYF